MLGSNLGVQRIVVNGVYVKRHANGVCVLDMRDRRLMIYIETDVVCRIRLANRRTIHVRSIVTGTDGAFAQIPFHACVRIVHNRTEFDARVTVAVVQSHVMGNLVAVNLHNRCGRNEVDSHSTCLRHSLGR